MSQVNERSHTSPDTVALSELAESLIADLPNHHSGRTAKTVMSGAVMRAVVVALAQGSQMNEHDAPNGATLQVLAGKVTLKAGEREREVHPGQLIVVPHQRHSVQAHADSAFLLTVALR